MSRPRQITALLATLVALLAVPAAAQADFGIAPGSLESNYSVSEGVNGIPQASSHPYAFTVGLDLNVDEAGHSEGGTMRELVAELPTGLIGNPFALPRCTRQEFEGALPQCSPNSQVGVVRVAIPGLGVAIGPLYNLVPPPGMAGQLGFSVAGRQGLQNITVVGEGEHRYALRDQVKFPLEVTSLENVVWGIPADSSHDSERGSDAASEGGTPHAFVGAHQAFLTLPAQCSGPLKTSIAVASELDPTNFVPDSALSLDPGGVPAAPLSCGAVPFNPQVGAQPTSRSASSPSGLDFELRLPNEGLINPNGIAETEPEKVEVTFPEGLTTNPSFAEGVSTCSQAQYANEQINTKPGGACPQASKLGSVIAHSPLLDEPIEGSLYLAAPYNNQFGSLLAVYMTLRAPERGVMIKQAGEVALDPASGQLHSTFEDLPPLPFSDFTLHFREGARAPLATPPACGTYQTTVKLYPFSNPTVPVTRNVGFQIATGQNGSPCPGGGLPPFHPTLRAGTENNAAGAYSPFLVKLDRSDSEQEFSHFSIKLPPGIIGKLAGIPYCSEAQIAQAAARTGPHGGAEELASPSCPPATQVGTTQAGAGVGTSLAYAPGKIYLAGPYHGSNLSFVAITSGVVGPFDVGTVVVRLALRINPETAEVFLDGQGSDPIPHIQKGVVLHLREIAADTDRPDFTFNPTSCKPTSTAATVLGSGLNFTSEADDNPFVSISPFQAADCASLPFGPKLSLTLKGGTKRGAVPALKAVLTARKGEANTGAAQITLPHSEFLEQSHIGTVCTRVQFKEGKVPGEKCPAASVYGKAEAITPVLSEPLRGPVYLRSSSHPLPDLVATLHNAQVDIALAGRIDSVQGGRIRNTFEALPDAPVTKFVLEMQGGKKGLLVNSTNLCKRTNRALSHFTGQNGKVSDTNPVLVAQGCKKAKEKAKAKAKKRQANRLALSAW